MRDITLRSAHPGIQAHLAWMASGARGPAPGAVVLVPYQSNSGIKMYTKGRNSSTLGVPRGTVRVHLLPLKDGHVVMVEDSAGKFPFMHTRLRHNDSFVLTLDDIVYNRPWFDNLTYRPTMGPSVNKLACEHTACACVNKDGNDLQFKFTTNSNGKVSLWSLLDKNGRDVLNGRVWVQIHESLKHEEVIGRIIKTEQGQTQIEFSVQIPETPAWFPLVSYTLFADGQFYTRDRVRDSYCYLPGISRQALKGLSLPDDLTHRGIMDALLTGRNLPLEIRHPDLKSRYFRFWMVDGADVSWQSYAQDYFRGVRRASWIFSEFEPGVRGVTLNLTYKGESGHVPVFGYVLYDKERPLLPANTRRIPLGLYGVRAPDALSPRNAAILTKLWRGKGTFRRTLKRGTRLVDDVKRSITYTLVVPDSLLADPAVEVFIRRTAERGRVAMIARKGDREIIVKKLDLIEGDAFRSRVKEIPFGVIGLPEVPAIPAQTDVFEKCALLYYLTYGAEKAENFEYTGHLGANGRLNLYTINGDEVTLSCVYRRGGALISEVKVRFVEFSAGTTGVEVYDPDSGHLLKRAVLFVNGRYLRKTYGIVGRPARNMMNGRPTSEYCVFRNIFEAFNLLAALSEDNLRSDYWQTSFEKKAERLEADKRKINPWLAFLSLQIFLGNILKDKTTAVAKLRFLVRCGFSAEIMQALFKVLIDHQSDLPPILQSRDVRRLNAFRRFAFKRTDLKQNSDVDQEILLGLRPLFYMARQSAVFRKRQSKV